jgi:predicted transposase YbfD/YdcC
VLGQLRVEGKSKEIPAVPELLAMLALDGCIVTADAMHAQTATAQAMLGRGGDYVLALKANQPALLEDVRPLLDDPEAPPNHVATTTDGDHGRIETRRAAIVHDVAPRRPAGRRRFANRIIRLQADDGSPRRTAFPALRRSARSRPRASWTARRRPPPATTCSPSRCWPSASSRPSGRTGRSRTPCTGCSTPGSGAAGPRAAVVMGEDQARARKDHAPESLARLRRFALNLLRASKDQGSTRGKLKRAGWDDAFLLKLLANAQCDCLVHEFQEA